MLRLISLLILVSVPVHASLPCAIALLDAQTGAVLGYEVRSFKGRPFDKVSAIIAENGMVYAKERGHMEVYEINPRKPWERKVVTAVFEDGLLYVENGQLTTMTEHLRIETHAFYPPGAGLDKRPELTDYWQVAYGNLSSRHMQRIGYVHGENPRAAFLYKEARKQRILIYQKDGQGSRKLLDVPLPQDVSDLKSGVSPALTTAYVAQHSKELVAHHINGGTILAPLAMPADYSGSNTITVSKDFSVVVGTSVIQDPLGAPTASQPVDQWTSMVSAAFSPDSRILAFYNQKTVAIEFYDIARKVLRARVPLEGVGHVRKILFSPQGTNAVVIAKTGGHGSLWILDLKAIGVRGTP